VPRTTGTTPATRQRRRQPHTRAAHGAWTASRAPATRCRHWTRSTASCPPRTSPTCGRSRTSTSTTPTTRPGTAATSSARCSPRQALTNRYGQVRPRLLRAGGAGAELREHPRQFEAFLDHSTNAAAPATGTIYCRPTRAGRRCSGPLQLRRRPGRQLLRREEGQPVRCTRCSPRQQHGDTGQPVRRHAGQRVGGGQGLRHQRKVLDDQGASGLR